MTRDLVGRDNGALNMYGCGAFVNEELSQKESRGSFVKVSDTRGIVSGWGHSPELPVNKLGHQGIIYQVPGISQWDNFRTSTPEQRPSSS